MPHLLIVACAGLASAGNIRLGKPCDPSADDECKNDHPCISHKKKSSKAMCLNDAYCATGEYSKYDCEAYGWSHSSGGGSTRSSGSSSSGGGVKLPNIKFPKPIQIMCGARRPYAIFAVFAAISRKGRGAARVVKEGYGATDSTVDALLA